MLGMDVFANWNNVKVSTPDELKKSYKEYGGKDTEGKTKKDKDNDKLEGTSLAEIIAATLRKDYPNE